MARSPLRENMNADQRNEHLFSDALGAHSDNRHLDDQDIDPSSSMSMEPITLKPNTTIALPMYVVGIGIFLLYTCIKLWSKRKHQEIPIQQKYSSENIRWNGEKRKFKFEMNQHRTADSDDNEEDQYAGLDADYVEYLKAKRQRELNAQRAMTAEQTQMQYAFDDMKNSFSFINKKLATNESRGRLTHQEITQLQERLAATEAQMYKILNAFETASAKVQQITQNTSRSMEQLQQIPSEEDRFSSRSASESESSENEEENSLSDEHSENPDDQFKRNNEDDEESSSSYEDEEVHQNMDDDDQSESSSDRYGLMETNYECDPTLIDDYELNVPRRSDPTPNSQTKVNEWRERNHSQSLSSSNSSINQDQPTETAPTENETK